MSGVGRGYDRSVNALIGAVVAVVLLVVGMYVVDRARQPDPPNPAATVDFTDHLSAARAEAPFDVLAPQPVPPGWRPTSVEAERRDGEYVWHLGFVVDETGYVAIDQATGDLDDFVESVTPAQEPGAPVDVDGIQWRTLTEPGGDDAALYRRERGSTTLVSGTVGADVLAGFAASLQAG